MRVVLANDPSAFAHTNEVVTGLYHILLAREPAAAELSYWQGQVRNGTTFAAVRAAIANDPASAARIDAQIDATYHDFAGRAANAGEVTYWHDEIRHGASLYTVRATIVADATAHDHIQSVITGIYQEYFGRAPTAEESRAWFGYYQSDLMWTYDTTRDELITDFSSNATGVRRFDATAGADTIDLGDHLGHSFIRYFNPAVDRIDLRHAGLTGVSPLDVAHAVVSVEVFHPNDVLLSFGDHDTILLRNVQLAQLSAANFLL